MNEPNQSDTVPCGWCKKPVPTDTDRCPACGFNFSKAKKFKQETSPPAALEIACPECHAAGLAIDENGYQCPICGARGSQGKLSMLTMKMQTETRRKEWLQKERLKEKAQVLLSADHSDLELVRFRHTRPIVCIVTPAKLPLAVLADVDGTICVMDVGQQCEVARVKDRGTLVDAIAISSDGGLVAIGGRRKRWFLGRKKPVIGVWRTSSDRSIRWYPLRRQVLQVGFAEDEATAFTLDIRGKLLTLDTGNGKSLHQYSTGGCCFSVSRDGAMVLVGTAAGKLALHDADHGKRIQRFRSEEPGYSGQKGTAHSDTIKTVRLSPDSRSAYSCSGSFESLQDCEIPETEVSGLGIGALGYVLAGGDPVTGLLVGLMPSMSGPTVSTVAKQEKAIADRRVSLCMWNTETGEQLKRAPTRGHLLGITSMDLSTDGESLLTGSHDGTALIWSTGRLLPFQRLGDPESNTAVSSIAFCSNSEYAVWSHVGQNSVLAWRLPDTAERNAAIAAVTEYLVAYR